MPNEKRKRGRPPLSPDEKERRLIEQREKSFERHKQSGYAAQKKYKETHKEKYEKLRKAYYEPKIRISNKYKTLLERLILEENLSSESKISISSFFINAVEEKYGIILHDKIDK